MKRKLTISGVSLGVHCTHWTTLDLKEGEFGDSAALGDMLHAKIEASLLGRPVPKFLDCKLPGRRELPERFWAWHSWATEFGLFEIPAGGEVLIEQQVAYNHKTGVGRLLGKPKGKENEKRNYELASDDEIPGTLDYARIVPSGPLLGGGLDVIVIDWKTYDWNGKKMWSRKLKHSSADMQTRSLAAILATIYKPRNLYAAIINIPPVNSLSGGRPFGELVQIDVETEVPEILMSLDGCFGSHSPCKGEHCKEHWCEAGPKKQNKCEAWKANGGI